MRAGRSEYWRIPLQLVLRAFLVCRYGIGKVAYRGLCSGSGHASEGSVMRVGSMIERYAE